MSIVKDLGLATEGQTKIQWVKSNMPVLRYLEYTYRKEQPFQGCSIGICLHLEAKTAYLAQVLQASGARVAITGSNPLSTQDSVAAALAEKGIEVFAIHGATEEEMQDYLNLVLKMEPDLLIDDGGDLVSTLHREKPASIRKIIGAAEETTTGIIRLRALENENLLSFPAMAVNDAFCKHLFDNQHGTGQSVWDGIMRATNLVIAGKTVVILGYGWCGKGVAARAQGLGARVIVTEVDPIKGLEAFMEGFEVMPLADAASKGDILVTVTGCNKVIRGEHYPLMKNGAILANAGHFDVEIDVDELNQRARFRRKINPCLEELELEADKKIYLLGEGRLVNLVAGDGHPAEIMDLSFALQYLSLKYMLDHKDALPYQVHSVPSELDYQVARLKLKSSGINIDSLTQEQKAYLRSWSLEE